MPYISFVFATLTIHRTAGTFSKFKKKRDKLWGEAWYQKLGRIQFWNPVYIYEYLMRAHLHTLILQPGDT